MCFSICNCSLMRLIRLHGMLKTRSRNAASADDPALHVGIILDILQYYCDHPSTTCIQCSPINEMVDSSRPDSGMLVMVRGGIGSRLLCSAIIGR